MHTHLNCNGVGINGYLGYLASYTRKKMTENIQAALRFIFFPPTAKNKIILIGAALGTWQTWRAPAAAEKQEQIRCRRGVETEDNSVNSKKIK